MVVVVVLVPMLVLRSHSTGVTAAHVTQARPPRSLLRLFHRRNVQDVGERNRVVLVWRRVRGVPSKPVVPPAAVRGSGGSGSDGGGAPLLAHPVQRVSRAVRRVGRLRDAVSSPNFG